MTTEVDLLSLTLVGPRGCSLFASVGGRPPATHPTPAPASHVAARWGGAARGLEGVKRVVKVLVRAVYVFPLLLGLKAVLWLFDVPWGDYLTVVFVALVTLLFAFLAVALLLFFIAGPRSLRRPRWSLITPGRDAAGSWRALTQGGIPPRTAPADLAHLLAGPIDVPRGPLRVRGRVRRSAGAPPDVPALRDSWLAQDGAIGRLTVGHAFAVVPEDGPPVVVDLAGAPWVVGGELTPPFAAPAPAFATAADAWLVALDGGALSFAALAAQPAVRIREGELVELVATRCRPVEREGLTVGGRRFALDEQRGAATPYREGIGRVLLVTSTPDAPVLLVVGAASG